MVWFTLRETFSALKHRNYRLWFFGQMVSLVGSWMQTTAQGYLVFELTRSPAYLGYVGFMAGLPAWLFTLYGGVIADRFPRRSLLMLTQSFMMCLAGILAFLVFMDLVHPWHILALAFLLGIANAFDAPARHAFVIELVEREDLTNAIALNSTMFNIGTVVGPAIAGVTYAAFGPAWCFTLNSLSFLAVIGALAMMRIRIVSVPAERLSAAKQLAEGFRFTINHPVVRVLVLNMAALSILGFSMMTLLPAWSVKVLGGDVRTNGLLLSSRGIGALAGALVIAATTRFNVKGKLWSIGSLAMPVLMIAFSATRLQPFAMILLSFIGWSFMVQANTSNALIQIGLPDNLRGRVMSIYTLTFFGGMPLGSLLVGLIAARTSEPLAVFINAFTLLLVAVGIFFLQPDIRKLE